LPGFFFVTLPDGPRKPGTRRKSGKGGENTTLHFQQKEGIVNNDPKKPPAKLEKVYQKGESPKGRKETDTTGTRLKGKSPSLLTDKGEKIDHGTWQKKPKLFRTREKIEKKKRVGKEGGKWH